MIVRYARDAVKGTNVNLDVLGHDGKTHLRLAFTSPKGHVTVSIGSSPKNVDHSVKNTRRAVMQAVAALS